MWGNTGLAAALVLALATPMTWFDTPEAAASHQFLSFSDSGDASATFGPNQAVLIDGAIEYLRGCGRGVDDFFYPIADIFVVPTGSAGAGVRLADASGAPNTVFGVGSGAFVSELIAYTAPGGALRTGTYDVVFDECQDGHLSPEDAIFPRALTVRVPVDVPPLPDAGIAAAKAAAAQRAEHWEQAHTAYAWLFKAAGKVKPDKTDVAKTIMKFVAALEKLFGPGIDVKKGALTSLVAVSHHYKAIAADPPRPDFGELTVLSPRPLVDVTESDPIEAAGVRLGAAAADENAAAEALLAALERYQGADAAGDGGAALVQARAAAGYARLVAATAASSATALGAARAALAADPRDLDAIAADIRAFEAQLATSGLSPEMERIAANFGLDAAARDALVRAVVTDRLPVLDRATIADRLSEHQAATQAFADTYADLAGDLADLAATLVATEGVFDDLPVADAGGPYAAAIGDAVALDGSASTAATAIAAWRWDLDGDGEFDEAAGATPTVTLPPGTSPLLGLEVTDDAGRRNVGYTTISLTPANARPQFTGVSPAGDTATVPVGDLGPFAATAADDDGDVLRMQWRVGGADVAEGGGFDYAPAAADAGLRGVEVVVTDGRGPGGTVRHQWVVDVPGPDADGDGWQSHADCDDTDATVNPGAVDVRNGRDDDCDPATPDGGTAPIVDAGPNLGGVEGDVVKPVITFTHPDASGFTATVDWGDGAGPEPAPVANRTVQATHAYGDGGARVVRACVAAAAGAVGCDDLVVDVAHAAPVPEVADEPETIVVPVLGNKVRSKTVLEAGRTYRLEARGMFFIGGPGFADAEYAFTSTNTGVISHCHGDPRSTDLGIGIDDTIATDHIRRPDWGAFRTDHAYDALWVGEGAPIAVSYSDCNYGDNRPLASPMTLTIVPLGAGRASGVEGEPLVVTVPFRDPGFADTHTATIDWGDGTPAERVTVNPGELTGSHRYADNGSYEATVCVTDDDGDAGCAPITVTVANAAPTVNAGADVRVSALAALAPAAFTDPGAGDTHTATVDWGDGTVETLTVDQHRGSGTVAGSHTYAADGSYAVRVCVTDDDGAAACDELVAHAAVANRPPVVELDVAHEIDRHGGPHLHAVGVSDPNPGDVHSGTIDWGDGSSPEPLLVTQGRGVAAAFPTHRYERGGTYEVTVTVCDDRGACDAASVTETVANTPPVPDAGGPYVVAEGDRLLLNATGSTDPDGDSLTFTWTFAGETRSGPIVEFDAVDDFAGEATLTVDDGRGGTAQDTAQVTVENVPPAVDAGPDLTIPWGVPLPLRGSVSDPGPADTAAGFDVTWDFGDGSAPGDAVDADHVYGEPGDFTATLTAVDKDGGSGSDSAAITVARRATSVDYTGTTGGAFGFTTLSARVGDAIDPATAALAGLEVSFTVAGQRFAATSDAAGDAVVAGPVPVPPGVHAVEVDVAGNRYYEPSSTTATVVVANSVGKVTGGALRTPGGGNAGFVVNSNAVRVGGELQYRDDRLTFHADELTALGIAPDGRSAWFSGVDRDGREFLAYVEDNGEPGDHDVFRLAVDGRATTADGPLRGGNIAIHR